MDKLKTLEQRFNEKIDFLIEMLYKKGLLTEKEYNLITNNK